MMFTFHSSLYVLRVLHHFPIHIHSVFSGERPFQDCTQQLLFEHTAKQTVTGDISYGIIANNAKLLWQHEAAPADQGLAAGGPLTPLLEPL